MSLAALGVALGDRDFHICRLFVEVEISELDCADRLFWGRAQGLSLAALRVALGYRDFHICRLFVEVEISELD